MAIAGYVTRGVGPGSSIPIYLLRGLSVTTSLTEGSTGYTYPPSTATAATYTYGS
jgi:hypothetical protein